MDIVNEHVFWVGYPVFLAGMFTNPCGNAACSLDGNDRRIDDRQVFQNDDIVCDPKVFGVYAEIVGLIKPGTHMAGEGGDVSKLHLFVNERSEDWIDIDVYSCCFRDRFCECERFIGTFMNGEYGIAAVVNFFRGHVSVGM